MLQALRENTKIILWIVIAAFVGLIFLVWGADITGSGSGRRGGATMVVGKVNGRDITIEEYDQAYNEELTLYRGDSDVPVLPGVLSILRERAWDRVINSALVKNELEDASIQISPEEIVHAIRTNPPDFLRQEEAFQTDGRFDYGKYRQAIDDPTIDWRWLENYFRSQLPYNHLQQKVGVGARVTEGELRDLYVQRNETVDFGYVAFLPDDFENLSFDVTEEEIRAWYDEHRDEFQMPQRAELAYVQIPVVPGESDYDYLRRRMEEILQRIEDGTPFTDLAKYYSESPTASQGGDIGVFARGQMTPELEEAAFALQEDEVSGVLEAGGGMQIVQLVEKKPVDGKEGVHLRQIFLRIEAGGVTIEQARMRAEAFSDTAEAAGFDEAARRESLEVTRTGYFEEGSLVPTLGEFRAANIFAFAAGVGEVSDPFFERERYFVFSLVQRDSARVASLEEIEEDVRAAVIREKRLERAREEAEKYASLAGEGASLERIARQANRAVESASSLSRIGTIPGIGPDTKLILAAFQAPDGEVAGPLSTDFGSYFLRRDQVHPIDEDAYAREKSVLLRSLLVQRQDHLFSIWLDQARENASIEDKRPPLPGEGEMASG